MLGPWVSGCVWVLGDQYTPPGLVDSQGMHAAVTTQSNTRHRGHCVAANLLL